MNTSALKTFAPAVRRQLMEAVTRKLDFVLSTKTPDYLTTFAPQVSALRDEAKANRTGLIERVAYTWFNRFAALRYLDAKGWHPFRARVLTSATPAETQPELLKLMRTGALPEGLQRHTDVGRLNDLLDGRMPTAILNADPQGEVYRHLVLAACRFYHSLLPDLFEKLDDETELLLPDDLLTEHSVVHGFRTKITDEDCAVVEVLGWLYQFYIAEKKDEVMARKSAVPTEDIPAVTQLFTPHWIVRYLVENSLGRLWVLNRPSSRLREQMPYFIEGESETDFLKIGKPEEIRVLDPAVGSGHMLTYAFDLLYAIYEEQGYAPSDIARLILTHNLHGLDIDPRAAQLASLALVLKAREKSRRFFQPEKLVQPHVFALQDVRFEQGAIPEYVRTLKVGNLFDEQVLKLAQQFENATTFGSLIQPCVRENCVTSVRQAIEERDLGSQFFLRETHLKVLRVLRQAEMLSQRYHVVVANPPYMGSDSFNYSLKAFVETAYTHTRTDLFALFIWRNLRLCMPGGYCGMITMHSWMFLGSYESLREDALTRWSILSLLHLGSRAFDFLPGEVVQAASFVLMNKPPNDSPVFFVRLLEGRNEAEKEQAFLTAIKSPQSNLRFTVLTIDLLKIPGSPIAYWLSRQSYRLLGGPSLSMVGDTKRGLQPGNVPAFVRLWWEVSFARFELQAKTRAEALKSRKRWFKFDSGGTYRKWFGNNLSVVDWEDTGRRIKAGHNPIVPSEHLYFEPGFVWSKVGTGLPSFRLHDGGVINGDASPCFFPTEFSFGYLALLNSVCASHFLSALSPTLNFQVSDILKIPICSIPVQANTGAELATSLVRADWDAFETSWNFCDLPLLRPASKAATLKESLLHWKTRCDASIKRLRELETEINRLFIHSFGLQTELSPEVEVSQITLSCNPAYRFKKHKKKQGVSNNGRLQNVDEDLSCSNDEQEKLLLASSLKEFLSYAVGCMMGRYSLDQPGLVLADAGDTFRNYVIKVGKQVEQLTFAPAQDGIIPILDGDWFEDDVVARTREFLRVTFGKSTLNENIRFIEESLGKDLRKYFLTDFYRNHISNEQTYGYKKRPIYWLVQSPQKGFSALIYLHRYTRDTMNLVLNRYLRPYQEKLRNRLVHLARVQLDQVSARDKTAARKEHDKLTKILRECEEWERQTILPLAQQRIDLDLDDGVKVNYQKLGEALAPIPGLASTDE